jgi:hypothetical protein
MEVITSKRGTMGSLPTDVQSDAVPPDLTPVKVALLGQRLWTLHLARLMERHAPELIEPWAATERQAVRLLARRRARQPQVLLRVGYRPGAPTLRGRAFDVLWRLLRAAARDAVPIHYWIGSDVLHTLRDASLGRLTRAFGPARREIHFAGAPWLADELATVGVDAEWVIFPGELPTLAPPPLPDRFTVLSYVPDTRFAFYGGHEIMAASAAMPEVQFLIMGGRGPAAGAPPNVAFLGWQSDTAGIYARSSVVLRLVPHDNIGLTAREGLAYGRYVVYTQPLLHTIQVTYGSAPNLIDVLRDLYGRHLDGRLELNEVGATYVRREFDERGTTRHLARRLVAIASSGDQRP